MRQCRPVNDALSSVALCRASWRPRATRFLQREQMWYYHFAARTHLSIFQTCNVSACVPPQEVDCLHLWSVRTNCSAHKCVSRLPHLWISCCVFCMDVMEASISAISFTSLLQRAHWLENPGCFGWEHKIYMKPWETHVIEQVRVRMLYLHCLRTRVWALVCCYCSPCFGCSWTAGCWPSCASHSTQPRRKKIPMSLLTNLQQTASG